jgi:dimethylhistidine N-methyltransferase
MSVTEVQRPASSLNDDNEFRDDILTGLSSTPRRIAPRWLYDSAGSTLFEAITQLPEYYPYRAERSILQTNVADMCRILGGGRTLVEFGSGSSAKTPILLQALAPASYVPIDISGEFLRDSIGVLRKRFPHIPMLPVEADFTKPISLPTVISCESPVGFFPGSTLGNSTPYDAVNLLRTIGLTLGSGASLLIGLDLIKDTRVLIPAYDDASGVTAQFNLNLLHRINRELRANIPVSRFEHLARWNSFDSRIEMHLRATEPVFFEIDGIPFQLKADETIHTENSYKYDIPSARTLLRAGGWAPVAEWTDPDGLFAVILASNAAAS